MTWRLTAPPLHTAQCKRLEGGLDKLKEATVQLDELNRKLAEQRIVLAEKSAACEALLDEIVTNTAIGEWPRHWLHTLPGACAWCLVAPSGCRDPGLGPSAAVFSGT